MLDAASRAVLGHTGTALRGGAAGASEEELEPLTSRLVGSRGEARDLEFCSRGPAGAAGLDEAGEELLARQRHIKVALVTLATLGCTAALLHSPLTTVFRGGIVTEQVQGLSVAATGSTKNWGKDCWTACGGPGECNDFCGLGNACCRYGSTKDPALCGGIIVWGSLDYHTCVMPVNPAFKVQKLASEGVQHWGEDCWGPCLDRSGFCEAFCGRGNACCRWGSLDDAAECSGIVDWGSKDHYTCVTPVALAYSVQRLPPAGVEVLNWGMACLDHCGDTGYCPEFCGTGNVCCKWGQGFQAPECSGIAAWGSKEFHTCVAPAGPHFMVSGAPAKVQHWGEDCSGSCDGGGFCEDFCGLGNACCRWLSTEDPPECAGITEWGAKDRYTCVVPANPLYDIVEKAPGGVKNWGADCWPACEKSGFCSAFCGEDGACCKFGAHLDAPECRGIVQWGAKDRYTCVQPIMDYEVSTPFGEKVQNWGKDCWEACGGLAGACPTFCGFGNACCRFGSTMGPPECTGVTHFGSKEFHTCVAPVNLALYVNHYAEDCWTSCNGAGYCEDWCGSGNACCKFGLDQDPRECHGVTFFPTWEYHTCVKASGFRVELPSKPLPGSCIPGQAHDKDGVCRKVDHPALMTFYVYRPSNALFPELRNSLVGNIEGAMWYLHKSVIGRCPRTGHINRIIRYLVTVKNPATFVNVSHSQFGKLEAVNATDIGSSPEGMVVRCAKQPTSGPDYPSYDNPVLFKLPGGQRGGGECDFPDGEPDCTWKAEYLGEVSVDEMSDILDSFVFCSAGYSEYDWATDKGNGTSFWNKRKDSTTCKHRVTFVKELFRMKYPLYPMDIGEPECDSGAR